MKRLGISDPKSYVQKRFAGRPDQPFYTNNYALSSRFNDSVDAEIDDAISNKSWSDVSVSLMEVSFSQNLILYCSFYSPSSHYNSPQFK